MTFMTNATRSPGRVLARHVFFWSTKQYELAVQDRTLRKYCKFSSLHFAVSSGGIVKAGGPNGSTWKYICIYHIVVSKQFPSKDIKDNKFLQLWQY